MQKKPVNITPEYIIDVILRRRWYIIIPFCLAMVAGIFYSIWAPKVYQASTLILIEPQRVPQNYVRSIVTTSPGARIATISEQINSRTNLDRIVNEFHLFSGPEYDKLYPEDKLEILRKRIDVKITHGRGGNDAFSISYRGGNPEKTMNIANTLASYFINENLKSRESQALGTSDFLNEELSTMRTRLVAVEKKLKNHRKKYMGELPEQLQSNLAILERLQTQLTDRRQSLREEKSRLALVQQQIATPPPPPPSVRQAPTGTAGADVGRSSSLEVLKEQLAVLSARYTSKHPDVVKVKKMIADLEKEARQSKPATAAASTSTGAGPAPAPSVRPAINPALVTQREESRMAISRLEAEVAETQAQIAIYQSRVEGTPKREQELASLRRDYENIQTAYNSLLARKLEADIAVNMERKQKGEQFHILDTASLPQRPVKPDMRKLFILFLAAGLGIGGGIIFLLEYLDTSFRRPEDVESLGVSLLATIPVVATGKDRLLKRANQLLSVVSLAISLTLLTGFALISFKGQDAMLKIISRYIQI